MPDYTTRPLDAESWPDFAELVEAHNGVWGGCWCMGFHPKGPGWGRSAALNRAEKQERVRNGEAHAALVYDGDQCVGWCQFGVPEELPRIKNRKAYEEGLGELPDWRITCFFVGKGHRGQGVAAAPSREPWRRSSASAAERSRAVPTRSTAEDRPPSCTTAPSPCSSSRVSPGPAPSARPAGWSAPPSVDQQRHGCQGGV